MQVNFYLSRGAFFLVAMFVAMAMSALVFEPPYIGYLIAYVLFFFATAANLFQPQPGRRDHQGFMVFLWLALIVSGLTATAYAHPEFRDVFRDVGAIFSFFFGLVVVPRAVGRNWDKYIFRGLSVLGVIISGWTILAAVRAYFAGVSAYEWRGDYVPFANSWIPYFLVIEYVLARRGEEGKFSIPRIGLCLLAIPLSLSRTALVLLAIFAVALALFNARRWITNGKVLGRAIAGLVVAAVALPRFLGLDVVQQRIQAGVGEDDLSLGWRAMENAAAADFLDVGGIWHWLFGYGLGARVPLPMGVVDFDDNISIPLLHNSFWTIVVKFGLFGLAVITLAQLLLLMKAWKGRSAGFDPMFAGGAWLLVMVLGNATTLQGLTEWSHLVFYGISCAMLAKVARSNQPSRRHFVDRRPRLGYLPADPGAAPFHERAGR